MDRIGLGLYIAISHQVSVTLKELVDSSIWNTLAQGVDTKLEPNVAMRTNPNEVHQSLPWLQWPIRY